MKGCHPLLISEVVWLLMKFLLLKFGNFWFCKTDAYSCLPIIHLSKEWSHLTFTCLYQKWSISYRSKHLTQVIQPGVKLSLSDCQIWVIEWVLEFGTFFMAKHLLEPFMDVSNLNFLMFISLLFLNICVNAIKLLFLTYFLDKVNKLYFKCYIIHLKLLNQNWKHD